MVTEFFHWGPNPVALSLGPLQIRWYGVFFAAAFLVGFQIMVRIFEKEGKPVEDVDSMLSYMFVGTLVGARLGHCLFYEPGYYLSQPLAILKVWEGGLASHGASIGILTALYLYSKDRAQQPYLWVLARVSLLVALSGFFIRTGNFFNSEIIGRPSSVPWAVVFTRLDNLPRHPSQLYEAFSYLCIFLCLMGIYRREGAEVSSAKLLGLFFSLVFSVRFLLEFTKEPQAAFEASLMLNMGQLLSIPLILLGVALLFLGLKRKLP